MLRSFMSKAAALLLASAFSGAVIASPQTECLSGIARDWDKNAVFLASKESFTGNTTALYAVPRIERFSSKDPKPSTPPGMGMMSISRDMPFVSLYNLTAEQLAGPDKTVTDDNLNDIGFLVPADPATETFPDMVYARNANQRWAGFSLKFLDCLKLDK